MKLIAILMAVGYSIFGIFLALEKNYMDAFVTFTIAAIFFSGLSDISKMAKSGLAHIITGGIMGGIFGVYYTVEYLAGGFDHLINEGSFSFGFLWNVVGALSLATVAAFFAIHSRKNFKNSK